jgi:ZIP family zinc transporter
MGSSTATVRTFGGNRASLAGVAGLVGLVVLSAFAVGAELWKLLIISWVAFGAMAGFALPGARAAASPSAYRLVWGYGLAAGAMVTSAAVFLLPQALGLHPQVGGFGVAVGLVSGYGAHTVGHRLSHLDSPFDTTAAQLTAHALAAGAIMGIIYAALPELGLVLGLAIVSHKGPAGYAAARRLRRGGKPVSVLLLPAAATGLAALGVALVAPPSSGVVNAAVFGFGAGVFLHLAMDFLPECEAGGEVSDVAGISAEDHALLDRLRSHAVASTVLGGVAVFVGWLVLA